MFLSALSTYAQTDIETCWKEMPDSIIPILNKTTRAELVALYKSKDTLGTSNALGGKTTISKLTPNFIEVELTKASSLQILLLQENDSTQILCMQKSFGSPVLESEMTFYSTNWARIDKSFGLPDTSNEKALMNIVPIENDSLSKEKAEELKSKLNPVMARTTLSENEGGTLTLYLDTVLLTEEEKNMFKNIKMQKSLKWENGFFK